MGGGGCSYSGWLGPGRECGMEQRYLSMYEKLKSALWPYTVGQAVHILSLDFLFSSLRYKNNVFSLLCSLWQINNPHLLSWQLALHFCPSLPEQSPERPDRRHLGDRLPISPIEHLWGWALLQSSSSTWGEKRNVVNVMRRTEKMKNKKQKNLLHRK